MSSVLDTVDWETRRASSP